jgi:hypothetical protein
MTYETADFSMKYHVTFTVVVTDPELLLKKARAISGKFQQIMDEIIIESGHPVDPDHENYEAAEIDSIEEALCWMLPSATRGTLSRYSIAMRWRSESSADDRRHPRTEIPHGVLHKDRQAGPPILRWRGPGRARRRRATSVRSPQREAELLGASVWSGRGGGAMLGNGEVVVQSVPSRARTGRTSAGAARPF